MTCGMKIECFKGASQHHQTLDCLSPWSPACRCTSVCTQICIFICMHGRNEPTLTMYIRNRPGGGRFRTLIGYRLMFRSLSEQVRFQKLYPVRGRGTTRLRPNRTVMVVSRTHDYTVPGNMVVAFRYSVCLLENKSPTFLVAAPSVYTAMLL
jgi:hypothetical protein